jgi:hypothetical protein
MIESSSFNDSHWRENYGSRPYVKEGSRYEDYQAAYQVGHEGCDRYPNQSFDEAESQLRQDYESLCAKHTTSAMSWDLAKPAVQDAWDQAATT